MREPIDRFHLKQESIRYEESGEKISLAMTHEVSQIILIHEQMHDEISQIMRWNSYEIHSKKVEIQ